MYNDFYNMQNNIYDISSGEKIYNNQPPNFNQIYQQPYNPTNPNNLGYNSIMPSYNYQNNGGYYSNNYNSYDYYERIHQEELYKSQMQEQYDIDCILSKSASSCLGHEINVDGLYKENETFNNKYPYIVNRIQEINNYNYLLNLNENKKDLIQINTNHYNNYLSTIQDKNKLMHKQDISFYDYFQKTAGELYAECFEKKLEEQNKNLNNFYSHNDYEKLLQMHNSNKSMFKKEYTQDDMNITLPTELNTEYNRRRQQFLASIMNNEI